MRTQRRRQASSAAGLLLLGLALSTGSATGCLSGEALDPFEPQEMVPMQKLTTLPVSFTAPSVARADCDATSDGQGGMQAVGMFNGNGTSCSLDGVLKVTVPTNATRPRLRFFHRLSATTDFDVSSTQFFVTVNLTLRVKSNSVGELPFLFAVSSYQASNAGSEKRFPYGTQEVLLPLPDATAGEEVTISLDQFYRHRSINTGNPPTANTLTWSLKSLSLEATVPVTPPPR